MNQIERSAQMCRNILQNGMSYGHNTARDRREFRTFVIDLMSPLTDDDFRALDYIGLLQRMEELAGERQRKAA